jgi:hypothetical protein
MAPEQAPGSPDEAEKARPVVHLHLGAPKSGTTYLQQTLWDNRAALRENGVLYPGEAFHSHTHAVLDLTRQRFYGHEDPAIRGAWQRMVDEIRAWGGPAVISQELLSPARPDVVERALSSLDFAEVHLVYTARDLARQVPAAWQENVKNRYDLPYEEFVATLRAPAEEMHTLGVGFWRMQDAADVLERWGGGIPPERVHLVTVRPGDGPRDLLWRRFCAVLGLDPGAYALPEAAANVSLGLDEAGLLLRLNAALDASVRWPLYNQCVTGLLGVDVLPHRPRRRRIALPSPDRTWLAERSGAMVAELRKRGYHVVGDLDELLPGIDPVPAAPDDVPEDAAMLEAAVDAMTALLGRLQTWRDDLDRAGAERDRLHADLAALRAELDLTGADRDRLREENEELRAILGKPATKLFVRRLSERHRSVMRLRIIYWNVVEAARRLRR